MPHPSGELKDVAAVDFTDSGGHWSTTEIAVSEDILRNPSTMDRIMDTTGIKPIKPDRAVGSEGAGASSAPQS